MLDLSTRIRSPTGQRPANWGNLEPSLFFQREFLKPVPALSNERHELFCQAIVQGKSRQESYVIAGYRPSKSNCSTLANKSEVRERILELQNKAAAMAIDVAALNTGISKAWVLDCLKANVLKGLAEEKASSVANRALQLIGLELGMFVERHEQGKPGDFAHLSDEELDAQLTQRLKARGLTDKQIRGFLVLGGPRSEEGGLQ
jgi:phage terminase small subunit